MGKRFPEEFDRIGKVKSNDKLLINDSEDGLDKYATPAQFNASLKELETHYDAAVAAKNAALDAMEMAKGYANEAGWSASNSESEAAKSADYAATAETYSDNIKESVEDITNIKTLLGYSPTTRVVNLQRAEYGQYVKYSSRSAVANAAFAISEPFNVEACSELIIKIGFDPSDAAHKGLDLSVIAIYEEIERQRTVQNGNTSNPTYTVKTYIEKRYLPYSEDRFVHIPDSGYYVANIPMSCKVVISYKPGISDEVVIVERHGALANLTSQVLGIYGQKTLVECMASLEGRIKALEDGRGLLGNATAGIIDVRDVTKCRYPLVMRAHGVPAEANVPENLPEGFPWDGLPAFVGQLYINLDAASGGLYYAVSVDSVNGWKQA